MLIKHSGCGIPALQAYEKESRANVCLGGLERALVDGLSATKSTT